MGFEPMHDLLNRSPINLACVTVNLVCQETKDKATRGLRRQVRAKKIRMGELRRLLFACVCQLRSSRLRFFWHTLHLGRGYVRDKPVKNYVSFQFIILYENLINNFGICFPAQKRRKCISMRFDRAFADNRTSRERQLSRLKYACTLHTLW